MAKRPPTTSRPPHTGPYAKDMEEVERLAELLDSAVRVPIIGYRIGLDGLLGLIPGIGDFATLLPAGYIIYKGRKMGVSNDVLLRMIANTGLDTAIGTVPLIGDLFDIAFKSNLRNVELLRRHVAEARMKDVTPPTRQA